MKKRLISMLMAVLMIASLLPASAVFAGAEEAAPAMLSASFAAMQLTSRVRRRQLHC